MAVPALLALTVTYLYGVYSLVDAEVYNYVDGVYRAIACSSKSQQPASKGMDGIVDGTECNTVDASDLKAAVTRDTLARENLGIDELLLLYGNKEGKVTEELSVASTYSSSDEL